MNSNQANIYNGIFMATPSSLRAAKWQSNPGKDAATMNSKITNNQKR
jgi:hypothetical protein